MNVVIEKKCEEHYNLLNKHFKLFLDLKKFLSKDKYIIFYNKGKKTTYWIMCSIFLCF